MISRLHHLVSQAARKWPKNTAIIEAGAQPRSITYGQLERKVQALSESMLRKGLKKGSCAGIASKNSIDFVANYFAISRAGAIPIPLNKRERAFSQRSNLSHGRVQPPKDVASIIYTSGTTGEPLGVMLSHKNLISNNRSVVKYMRLSSADRICCVLPFYYIYGLSLLLSHFLAGGTVIIDNRFMYPNIVLDTIDKHKATGFAGVSSHYAIMLLGSDLKERKLPTLRYFMQAGDRMHPNITRELIDIFPNKKLYIMYGQTEASPRLTYLNPNLVERKPDSIGKAIPGVEIKIVNRRGDKCNVGEKGEIIARGDNVMLGYLNNAGETAKAIKKGWLYTGDIAYRDNDGDLFITGRKKNIIKVGANRVDPLEIENLMMEDKRIMEAAVVGIPDTILGEKIKLFAALMPGENAGRSDIIALCKERLPSYKVPSEVVILKSMPRNSFGKIDKEALKLK